ncbi:MAG: Holliday junction branch migration protein RuvA [Gammaproteobacteria bacterium]|nr:Holliday junction branch migration protein RuvA [Gammaproteobacteria bacterium]
MIGQIEGTIIEKNPPEILVEVAGITYEILVPMSTLYQLPESGELVRLHTHFSVREDAQTLYGFFDAETKKMFRSLVRVNGVGPKMALGILSGMSVEDFVQAVRNNDSEAMVRMPGIGKKTAERLMIEMRDKMIEWGSDDNVGSDLSSQTKSSFTKDAEIAMINLGYKPQQAARAIAQALKVNPEINDSEELIRFSLKSMI